MISYNTRVRPNSAVAATTSEKPISMTTIAIASGLFVLFVASVAGSLLAVFAAGCLAPIATVSLIVSTPQELSLTFAAVESTMDDDADISVTIVGEIPSFKGEAINLISFSVDDAEHDMGSGDIETELVRLVIQKEQLRRVREENAKLRMMLQVLNDVKAELR